MHKSACKFISHPKYIHTRSFPPKMMTILGKFLGQTYMDDGLLPWTDDTQNFLMNYSSSNDVANLNILQTTFFFYLITVEILYDEVALVHISMEQNGTGFKVAVHTQQAIWVALFTFFYVKIVGGGVGGAKNKIHGHIQC